MISNSFFTQDSGNAEIEIPRKLFTQWLKKFQKGEKLAAKIEFKNKQANLIIVDESTHVINLNELVQNTHQNVLFRIDGGLKICGFVQHGCKPKIGEDEKELENKFRKLSHDKDSNSIEVDEQDSDSFREPERLELRHEDYTKNLVQVHKLANWDNADKGDIQNQIMAYARSIDYGYFTLRQLKEDAKLHYQDVLVLFIEESNEGNLK